MLAFTAEEEEEKEEAVERRKEGFLRWEVG